MRSVSPALRRRFVFAALYLSEGAPIGFLWTFLATRLKSAGLPIQEVTALAGSLALPWALKVFWAPLLDAWRGPRFGYRAWMLGAQAVMAGTLLPLGWLDLVDDFRVIYMLCIAHAVAAATQDVAIDALAIAATPPEERGTVNGWMQAGMFLGRALFGGLALAAAAGMSLRPVVVALALVVVAIGLVAVRSPVLAEPAPSRRGGFLEGLARVALTPVMARALLFALIAGAGFEALGEIAGPYLVDLGYDERGIGLFLGIAKIACIIAGALVGGRVADRAGPRKASVAFLSILAITIVIVALTPPGPLLFLALGGFFFAIGLFTAASYALFMNLATRGYGATQFTACMAMTNFCESWAIFSAGWIMSWKWVEKLLPKDQRYSLAFLVLAGVSLVGIALVPRLRVRESGE